VTRVATLKAAFKAFVFNKISDVFLFVFILLTFNTFYDLDILTFNSEVSKYLSYNFFFGGFNINLVEFLSFLLIGSAFIKSAQIGTHL
jgi:NADH:ubiquinone oxidoreductase subunit 5 (subunit L)/multisubunit Na+/H+ antiporter MnhA subunit